ncbi:MAG: penicillin-insensitive murein endopeptidase [Pseudolabrys sp.]
MFGRILTAALLSCALGAASLVVCVRPGLAQSPAATDQPAPAATPAPSAVSPDSATAPIPSPAASTPSPASAPTPATADEQKLKDEQKKAAEKKETDEKAKKEAEEKEKKEKAKEAKKELFEHESTEPAKKLFSAVALPTIGKAVSIGYYPRGCLQGGVALPTTGKTWQVMRLSRNRNWGNPELVHFLERFAPLAAKATGWHGILIGDMAQPRGGPLPFGHLSHQIGLDVDIWFMPMPGHVLTREEREKTSASNLVSADWKHIDPKTWSPADVAFIRTAAEQPEVERVLVNAAIKKELCRIEGKQHFGWLAKVRPWYGHNDHIHVRLKCPADSPNCRKQPPVPGDDGCNKSLDYWFSDKVLHPKKRTGPPPKPIMLADLPAACKAVLNAPARSAAKN